jgi:hypothetical protein
MECGSVGVPRLLRIAPRVRGVGHVHQALRSRRRIPPRGVTEYWSLGVLREVRIAPHDRGVGDAGGEPPAA